jgi:hypothetical protein
MDIAPGTTGGDGVEGVSSACALSVFLNAPHGLPLVTHQLLHSASFRAVRSIYPQCFLTSGRCLARHLSLLVVSSLLAAVVSLVLAGHWAGGSLGDALV